MPLDISLASKAGVPVVLPTMIGPTAYTPIFTGMGTVTGIAVFYSQVGTRAKVWGTWKNGAATGVLAKMSLPPGMSISSTYHTQSQNELGYGTANAGAIAGVLVNGVGFAFLYDSADATSVYMATTTDTIANDKVLTAQNGGTIFNSTSRVAFSFEFEVAGASVSTAYGAGLATSVKSGLIAPSTPQTGLTFSSTPAGWSLVRAVGVAYSDSAGVWRLKFNVDASCTAGTNNSFTFSGTTFKNGSNQAVSAMSSSAANPVLAYAASNSGQVSFSTASTNTVVRVSGDVELDSKPSWA